MPLKKIIALFLLSLHFFGLGAGLLAHEVTARRIKAFFEEQTGRGLYNINDLTEVKIPTAFPYVSDQSQYNKVFGEVRFADAAYNYVGMRITRHAIYLLCVPDYSTTKLCGQNIIEVKNIRDIPVNAKGQAPVYKNLELSAFNCHIHAHVFTVTGQTVFVRHGEAVYHILKSSISRPGEPPESA